MAAFALAGVLAALLISTVVAVLQLHQRLPPPAMFGIVLAACAVSLLRRGRALPATQPAAARRAASDRCAAWCAPLSAGLVCAVLCAVSAQLGPLLSGLVLGLPLVALSLAVLRHLEAGPAAAVASLYAYPEGLLLRALFAVVLAIAAPAAGAVPAFALATALTLAAGLMCVWPQQQPAFAALRHGGVLTAAAVADAVAGADAGCVRGRAQLLLRLRCAGRGFLECGLQEQGGLGHQDPR